MTTLPPEITHFASQLADMAGEIIRPAFRSPLNVEHKSDLSPVTDIDRRVEAALRKAITEEFPQHGIIGEEGSDFQADAEYIWVLDPIDGTKSFIAGIPLFGTLISLIHRGNPVLGIIDQPILKERWVGITGKDTLLNGKRVHTSTCATLKDAVLSTTGPHYFTPEGFVAFERVRKASKYVLYGYDCYAYGLVASGKLDIVVESTLKIHDYCALAPIVTGAGGFFTDWSGNSVVLHSDGNVVAAATEALGKEALELLA